MNRNILITTTALTACAYATGDQGTTATLPVGRIVWGHPTKPRPATDDNNNPKLGADGQQLMETSFGLAIPRAEFEQHVWPLMAAEAAKGYPQGAPSHFAWKMTQEHEIQKKTNRPYSEKEGYAGHVVLAVSTTLEPPGAFKWDGARWQQMQPDEIKCGDWVQCEINFKVNVPSKSTHTPSMYVNPRAIAFVGYGEPIQSGFQADPNAAFGNGPPPLPPGASATPVAGGPGVGMPGGGMPGQPGNSSSPATMPGAPSASSGAPASPSPAPPPPAPVQPSGPQRPTDPTHIHDNGNGTEQWFVNGAWDGGAHPAAGGQQLPPPATGFVANAAMGGAQPSGMPGAPAAGGGMPGQMPGR